MVRSTESWNGVLNRTLLLGCAFWIAFQTPVTAITLAHGGPAAPGLLAALAGRLTLVGLCLYAARTGLRPGLMTAGLAAGAVAMLGAGYPAWTGADLSPTATLMVPLDATQAVQIFAVATAIRLRTALWIMLATGPVHFAMAAPSGLGWDTAEQWITPTSASVALGALVVYLRAGSAYAEGLDVWNRAARERSIAAHSQDAAVAEARRVIHDDVISALRGITQGAPAPIVRDACRAALAAMQENRECASLEQLLEALVQEAPVEVRIASRAWPEQPPSRVLDAFRAAAGEALRNVGRHSGVAEATITATSTEAELVLRIEDRGRGLGDSTEGFGRGVSIRDRMVRAGGSAEISSTTDGRDPAPTGGRTTVTLTWPRPAPTPHLQVTPFTADQRWRGYLPVALAVTANSSFLAWRHPGPHPAAAFMLAAVCAGALCFAAWHFATRPSRRRDAPVVAAVVVSLTWVGLELAGPGGMLDMRSWVVGFIGGITMVYAFDARPRHVLLPVTAQLGLLLWFSWQDPTIKLLEPMGALTTPVITCGVSTLFGLLLRKGARLVRQSEATLAARQEEQAWQEAHAEARQIHLATLRGEVAPFLTRMQLAAPDDADLREASRLAARCRDELHLPQTLPAEVREAVDAARERGTTISFRVDGRPSAWPETLLGPLVRLLERADPEVVTLLPGESPRLVVLPALDQAVRDELTSSYAVLVHDDAVRSVVTLSPDRMPFVSVPVPVSK